jgi:hypothetical protein
MTRDELFEEFGIEPLRGNGVLWEAAFKKAMQELSRIRQEVEQKALAEKDDYKRAELVKLRAQISEAEAGWLRDWIPVGHDKAQ